MMRTRDLGILCAIGTVIMAIVWYSLSVTSTSEEVTSSYDIMDIPKELWTVEVCENVAYVAFGRRIEADGREPNDYTEQEKYRLDNELESCQSIESVTTNGDRNDND